AVVAEYEKDMRVVGSTGATVGGAPSTSGGYAYGTQSPEQEKQLTAFLKQQKEDLGGIDESTRAAKPVSKNKNLYKTLGANLTTGLSKIYGGAANLLGLDPKNLQDLKSDIGKMTRQFSATMSQGVLTGMRRQFTEIASDPSIQAHAAAQKDL